MGGDWRYPGAEIQPASVMVQWVREEGANENEKP